MFDTQYHLPDSDSKHSKQIGTSFNVAADRINAYAIYTTTVDFTSSGPFVYEFCFSGGL